MGRTENVNKTTPLPVFCRERMSVENVYWEVQACSPIITFGSNGFASVSN